MSDVKHIKVVDTGQSKAEPTSSPLVDALVRSLTATSAEPLLVLDVAGGTPTICGVSKVLAALLRCEGDTLLGRGFEDVFRIEDGRLADGATVTVRDQPGGAPQWVRTEPIQDASGTLLFIVARLHSTKATTPRITVGGAGMDTATGLPRWGLLRADLFRRMESEPTARIPIVVMLIDLSNARRVNRTLGHRAGRRLLSQVAQRLRDNSGDGASLSRLSGDTFGLVVSEKDGRAGATRMAESLVREMRAPFDIDGSEVFVNSHVGIAVHPRDGHDPDTLLRNAENALEASREKGFDGYAFFEEEMHDRACEHAAIEGALRQAVERGELSVVFQPQVATDTRRIVGAETLVRWKHPEWGAVSPARFIPVAEDMNLIGDIGRWVLREACQQAASWRKAGLNLPRIGVNIAADQLRSGDLLETVMAALADAALPAEALDIELTETTVMQDVPENSRTLELLRRFGVRIAVDDFGTGYSSLKYVRSFPIDIIKIDRSFVTDIDHSADCQSIVRAVLDMSKELGIEVIAEGAETPAEFEYLRDAGCPIVQGYYTGRPTPADSFAEMLRRNR